MLLQRNCILEQMVAATVSCQKISCAVTGGSARTHRHAYMHTDLFIFFVNWNLLWSKWKMNQMGSSLFIFIHSETESNDPPLVSLFQNAHLQCQAHWMSTPYMKNKSSHWRHILLLTFEMKPVTFYYCISDMGIIILLSLTTLNRFR